MKKILTLFLPALISENIDYKSLFECIVEDNKNLEIINQLFSIVNNESLYDVILNNIKEIEEEKDKVKILTKEKK